jgi:hypothetical protein
VANSPQPYPIDLLGARRKTTPEQRARIDAAEREYRRALHLCTSRDVYEVRGFVFRRGPARSEATNGD